jgi:hypothetical protein
MPSCPKKPKGSPWHRGPHSQGYLVLGGTLKFVAASEFS